MLVRGGGGVRHDSVTDIGVSYVAECYYSTLQVVLFSNAA